MRELHDIKRDVGESSYAGTTGQWLHCALTIKEYRDMQAKARLDPRETTWLLTSRGMAVRPCIVDVRKETVIVSQLLGVHTYYRYGKELRFLKNTDHYCAVRNLPASV